MSIVLYAYRIPRKDLWTVVDHVRQVYRQQHPALITAADLSSRFMDCTAGAIGESPGEILDEVNKLKDSLTYRETVELMLYDEGDSWLFRVPNDGWRLHNHMHEHRPDWPILPVFYDNRTDVPAEEEKNAPVADWVDRQTLARRYMLVPIVDRAAIHDAFWEPIFARDRDRVPA